MFEKRFSLPALLLHLFMVDLSWSLNCWNWNLEYLRDEEFKIERTDKRPQCLFQMDVPCNVTNIERSAHYTVTFSEHPHNSCILDIGKKKTNYLRLHYVVKIWKESKVYKADTDQARCMEAYKKACDNKEIIVGGIRRRPGDKYSDDYESLEDID
ncbi:hypothetical protein RB195_016984 [Necator americanus]|uniref:Lipocalin n=1 Tax=Necator americanus TaxID=51031 RepID=A0ABR1C686_NECAM